LTGNLQSQSPKVTATQARAGRIVKGGAIRRILWVSLLLAVLAIAAAYFVIR
jgi:hypothetical protein